MSRTRFTIIVALILALVIGGIVFYQYQYGGGSAGNKTAYITVTAAPSDSSVTLNKKKAQLGTNQVAPGTYDVTISHNGFASVTKNVTAVNGQDTPVGFALTPNASSTATWYTTHTKDAQIAATITDAQNSSSVANQANQPPFVSLLPYTAGGFEFTIAEDPDSNDPSNPLIYIEADSTAAQQDALTWIKNQGYDPTKMNLKYSSTTDPSRP